MKVLRIIGVVIVVILVLFLGFTWWALRTPSSPFDGQAVVTVSQFPVEKTSYVARLADCVACHSMPGQAPFSGGLAMGSPLGVIYSTNITPDKDTGIGNYSLADFDRAVRHGIAKDGHQLYPAMPYPSYAKLTDDDVKQLYDYFMFQVAPAKADDKPSEIPSPLNIRWPLAYWNAVFKPASTPYQDDTSKDADWNRGAYIVETLGHCGACHTPRGPAFNEVAMSSASGDFLSGAYLDAWHASNLRQDDRTGLGRWSEQDIVDFLKTGRNAHATVFGSMLDAFNNSTQFFSDDDIKSVAKYLKSLPPMKNETPYQDDGKTVAALTGGDLSARGAALYMKQCSNCHGVDGKGRATLQPPLAGNPSVNEADASSVINIMLNGAGRMVVNGVPDSYRMTPFRVLLRDDQIADIATFVRQSWGNTAPAVSAADVAKLRTSTDPTSDHVVVLQMR